MGLDLLDFVHGNDIRISNELMKDWVYGEKCLVRFLKLFLVRGEMGEIR